MNAAPLTAAQLSAMQENIKKWNARFVRSKQDPKKSKEARDFLMEKHFAALPHYVLD